MQVTSRAFCTGHIKPFSSIPGPKSLPVIGTLWCYLPIIGNYKFDYLHHNGAKKLREYGHVVKEEIVPGEPVVWIFRPEDVHELLNKEGRYPQRRSHLAIQHIRSNQPDKYNTGGLLPTNGTDWWRLRSNFQKELSPPQKVKKLIPRVNIVLEDFIDYVRRSHWCLDGSSTSPAKDFLHDLSRVFLELLGIVAFNSRLNSFTAEEVREGSRTSKLIAAALEANSCILKTDNGPQLWRFFPTPLYTKLKKAHTHMETVAFEELQKIVERQRHADTDEGSLVEAYLKSPQLDFKDVLGMTVDMILAGTDTTSYTSSFALYHLGRNLDKQEALYNEVRAVVGSSKNVDATMLSQCNYVKAVLKETLRLNPVSVGVGRLLQEDAVFSNYHVPKGTVVVTQNQVVCRSPEYFLEPDLFVPERWIKSCPEYRPVSPYLLLPFGHGARTCIARRLAEQNIQLLLIKMVQNFRIEWRGGDLDVRSLLINKPDGPILLRLTPREETS